MIITTQYPRAKLSIYNIKINDRLSNWTPLDGRKCDSTDNNGRISVLVRKLRLSDVHN
jgi:hypothetical protein